MAIRILLAAAILASVRAYLVHSEIPVVLKGAQVISVTCETEDHLAFVTQYDVLPGFEFMKVGLSPVDVQVFALERPAGFFKKALRLEGIKYKVLVSDFQKLATKVSLRGDNISKLSTYDFTYYPRYKEIEDYLIEISETHDNVSLFSIGKSYEGREIYGLKFSSGEGVNKPALLIDAGIHAREWIAPTTALYAISQLVNDSNKYLYEKIDWYILPQINPDGYEYSHTKDRFWQKSRSPNSGTYCMGVDLNTNFDYHWDNLLSLYGDTCLGSFAGRKAFSEVETKNFRDFVLSKNNTIKLYLTLHSFGQYILYPWSYTFDPIDNESDLMDVAKRAEAALSAVRGTNYTIGNSADLIYRSPGGSMDWMMGRGGVHLAYAIELPGRSFCTPKSQILPVGQETFEAFRIFGEDVADNYAD